MFFASTLRSRTSNARRACLESLEGRRLMSGAIETEPAGGSAFAVWNLADSGPGSLRQAISDANDNPGADLIRFAPAARDGTITLTSGQLSITDDLVLDGPGVDRLTLSGDDANRVFSVSGGATDVEIRDLTIANGRATGVTLVGPVGPVTLGGALLNTGARVAVFHVNMHNNQAAGDIAQG